MTHLDHEEILCFVGHPVSSDPTLNALKALIEIRRLMDTYPTRTFIAPWIDYVLILNDGIQEQRDRGMRDDLVVLKRCDELWLLGSHVSTGMLGEKALAESLGLRVVDRTDGCGSMVDEYGV